MDKEFKNYEIGFLTKTEQDRDELVKIIKNRQFSIIDDGEFSRIKLAYQIEKENFAYFGYLYFSGDPGNVKELRNELKTSLKILRFIIISRPVRVKKEEKQKETPVIPEKISFTAPASIISVAYPVKEKSEKPRTGTLSNEELEKKLEEILK